MIKCRSDHNLDFDLDQFWKNDQNACFDHKSAQK